MYKADNAVIMAAGTSSRFAPLSYERPKSLIPVKGEVLIERQIRQLKEAGIDEIFLVVGYQKEKFGYLQEKFGVGLIENDSYLTRNNNASIYAVREHLRNTYICSCDNYFAENPFTREVDESYYAAVYAEGETSEWCLQTDERDYITGVTVGGRNSWYMLGHTFWSEEFSRAFLRILKEIYEKPETRGMYWESIYMEHLAELKMKIRRYPGEGIFEFDSLDELREFDPSYREDSRSGILKSVAARLGCREGDIVQLTVCKDETNAAAGFRFAAGGKRYQYSYETEQLQEIQ